MASADRANELHARRTERLDVSTRRHIDKPRDADTQIRFLWTPWTQRTDECVTVNRRSSAPVAERAIGGTRR